MKNMSYFALAVAAMVMAGCADPYHPVRVNRADVDVGGARVILGDQAPAYPAGSGRFCPPGQAKKGRC